MDNIKTRVANLLTIKSIVTLVLTIGYIIMTVGQLPVPAEYTDLYKLVVIFYFGTQTQKVLDTTKGV